jgi:alpha-beta hydrolase superfamily lysophospholipase
MAEHLETFVDTDGVTVAFRRWSVHQPRGAVVVAHGASEHSGRYERFAKALNAAGWTVLAPDHRGHGVTADSSGRGLIGPRALDGVLDDLDEVVRRAHDAAGAGPVVLFGHSMGSIIALRYAEVRAGGLAALVLSGPLGVMPGVQDALTQLNAAIDAGMADQPMDALGAFNAAFEPARTPFDWLSRDEAEVDKYLADPLCGDDLPLTYGYVSAVFAGVADGARDTTNVPAALPVLLTAGELDPVGGCTAQVRALADLLRTAAVTVAEKYYPGARHEILNETNRDVVEADIVSWIEEVV